MSSRLGRTSPAHRARAHLVLVRGGRDESLLVGPRGRPTEDLAWRAFASRIGWKEPERDLPVDFEAELLSRVLGEDDRLPVGARFDAPHAELERTAVTARRPAASVALLVAALVGLAAAALLPLLARGAAPPATPDTSVVQAADRAPADTPPPTEPAREDEISPTQKAETPKPNGSPIARVARSRSRRPGARASAPPARPSPEPVAVSTPPSDRETFSEPTPPPPEATSSIRWETPSHSIARIPVVHPRPQARPDALSLTPRGDRWFGASLPPQGAPIDAANAGTIGVMATLDFARLASF